MALRARYQDPFTKKHGVKLGFMAFFVKAAVEALKAYPAVNAEIDGDEVVYKHHLRHRRRRQHRAGPGRAGGARRRRPEPRRHREEDRPTSASARATASWPWRT